jgi:hypothetical protein
MLMSSDQRRCDTRHLGGAFILHNTIYIHIYIHIYTKSEKYLCRRELTTYQDSISRITIHESLSEYEHLLFRNA